MITASSTIKCEKCKIRIPKHRPVLVCSICNSYKHYSCNSLSKNDAVNIINNGHMRHWTCIECITSILPINCTNNNTDSQHKRANTSANSTDLNHKPDPCASCNKTISSKIGSKVKCPWCSRMCHRACVHNSLGCTSCCTNIIPGYYYHAHEMSLGCRSNYRIFNPYDTGLLLNQMSTGHCENEDDDDDPIYDYITQQLNNCTYTEPKNIKMPKIDELKIMSLNIRSLTKNIENLRENIDYYKNWDVICLNEINCDPTTLANGLNDIQLEGFYSPITQKPFRASNKGGGLAVYINRRVCEEQDFEILHTSSEENTDSPLCESMFLQLKFRLSNGSFKKIIIGNFYRTPSCNPKDAISHIENIISQLDTHKNKHIILVGDFNVNLLNYETDIVSQDLINLTTRHGFTQVISRPTRITDYTATLIDHIYTNQIHNTKSTGIITYDISDHLATYISIALQDNSNFNHMMSTNSELSSKFNEENCTKFHDLLSNENWDNVLNVNDTQIKYDKFIETYTNHYDTVFTTTTTKRKKQRVNPKPWILPWLEEACDRKNRLYHAYVKDPSISNKMKYQKMKNFVNKHITKAKNKFYTSYFDKYNSNSRKQWQMINGLLNRSKHHQKTIKLRDSEGCMIKGPTKVAENFNNYFTNIAEKLKLNNRLNSDNKSTDHKIFLENPSANSIFINPTDPEEVKKTIDSLKNKSTSDTKICALKAANKTPIISIILSDIINSSFETGVFPIQLKMAKVILIHKNGAKTEVSNYRPISLLSSFSKIFEKLMHFRLVGFLEENNALHDMQYGFRSGRSCEHALLAAQNEILATLTKKQTALLLLIDFSKAFDMVDHDILLDKLHHYGIRGIAHTWFKSYLTDRKQYVNIDGHKSTTKQLKYSVPQGSILGPLLFIIYINDIPNIHKLAKFILYADDANIIITGANMHEIEVQFNELSTALGEWVNANGLSLNIRKTNYMIFTRSRNLNLNNFKPKLNNVPIEKKSEACFLGVLLDEKLTWKHHIAAIKTKMSRYISVLYKLKSILPLSARMHIYNSLIQSHLNYCSLVWGSSCKSNIESLFVTQKKAIRALGPKNVNYFYKDGVCPTHTKPIYSNLNILTVHNIILKNILNFIDKINNNTTALPISILKTIAHDAPSTNIVLENCMDWYNRLNTNVYRTSIFLKGPMLYTDIMTNNPKLYLQTANKYSFKKHIKTYLLDIQSSGDSQEWETCNFKLFNLVGLRRSNRIQMQSQARTN